MSQFILTIAGDTDDVTKVESDARAIALVLGDHSRIRQVQVRASRPTQNLMVTPVADAPAIVQAFADRVTAAVAASTAKAEVAVAAQISAEKI